MLTYWGKRYALALREDKRRLTGVLSTQQVPLSKTTTFAVTPLVLTPCVPFWVPEEAARHEVPDCQRGAAAQGAPPQHEVLGRHYLSNATLV